MTRDFSKLFYPSSVAIVGASETPGSVGDSLRKNLLCFKGQVYYVNPNHAGLAGLPCYPSLTKLPSPVDLAVVAVPAKNVISVIEDAAKIGCRNLVVISSGFKEVGDSGKALEETVRSLAVKNGINLIGPNCLGIMNPEIRLNTSFAGELPIHGRIAFVSQSGALMTAILDYAKKWNMGFSKCVSIGNKTVVDETDLLQYFASDTQTDVILLYVEDIADAARFVEAARLLTCHTPPKPIIFLKAGSTAEGARASASHTGALGGVDAYYTALARQSRTIRVSTISEFLNTGMVAACNAIPAGNNVAILTNAGGPGVLITDEAVKNGLTLAKLSDDTVRKLQAQLPNSARVQNPVDVLGDAKAETYEMALTALVRDPNVQSVVVLLTPQSGTEVEKTAAVIEHAPTTKPIIASFMGQDLVSHAVSSLRSRGIAVTEYPEEAARALGRYTTFMQTGCALPASFTYTDIEAKQASLVLAGLPNNQSLIPEREAGMILSSYGFPNLTTILAHSKEETVAAVAKIGRPCAVKISSPEISHKRDVGGVLLNITSESAALAYDTIIRNVSMRVPEAKVAGIIVKEMAPLGMECIIGISRQQHFGGVIMVGMGGTYVEVTKDVSFGILPICKQDAAEMISSLHAHKLFAGYRGNPALDVEALADCLGRLARLSLDQPTLREIDINPIIVYPKGQGVKVVDVRMVRDTA